MNKSKFLMNLTPYFLMSILFVSGNAFSEEKQPSNLLSGLQQFNANFGQSEQELLPPIKLLN